jgi:hypothetical protein
MNGAAHGTYPCFKLLLANLSITLCICHYHCHKYSPKLCSWWYYGLNVTIKFMCAELTAQCHRAGRNQLGLSSKGLENGTRLLFCHMKDKHSSTFVLPSLAMWPCEDTARRPSSSQCLALGHSSLQTVRK